mmetsp:Transcript_124166/g.397138  ORF Transcript_124166/g.397138 Transcript_124166/m.397138 type:complete len:364 (-) Transcript_124166:63-1154(-)
MEKCEAKHACDSDCSAHRAALSDSGHAIERRCARLGYGSLAALVVLAAAAVAWSRYLHAVARRPSEWGSMCLNKLTSFTFLTVAGCLGVTCYHEVDDSPHLWAGRYRQVLCCWHPHGLYVLSKFLEMGLLRDRDSTIGGSFTAVADIAFRVPVLREAILLANARAVNSSVFDSLLTAGKTTFICPGGIHEQLATDPHQERAFFPPKLGFVRQAIKHGVPLVPVYHFGENQLFDVPPWSRILSQWLRRKFHIGFPLGIGRFHLPLLPKKCRVIIRVGRLVEVGQAELEPSDEKVISVFFCYCLALRNLFDQHKATDLPPELARRGLELVWRGHEHEEDLSEEGLRRRLRLLGRADGRHHPHSRL